MWIKSTDLRNLNDVVGRVKTCAEGIARSSGAQVKIQHDYPLFEESIPNLTLMKAVGENLTQLGIPFRPPEETSRSLVYVSSDYGNVSHVAPSVSPAIAIGPETLTAHTAEFAEAAISKTGHEVLIQITKVMAMTGLDVLTGRVLEAAKSEYLNYRATGFTSVPLAPTY